jgi:hypothetical protein
VWSPHLGHRSFRMREPLQGPLRSRRVEVFVRLVERERVGDREAHVTLRTPSLSAGDGNHLSRSSSSHTGADLPSAGLEIAFAMSAHGAGAMRAQREPFEWSGGPPSVGSKFGESFVVTRCR